MKFKRLLVGGVFVSFLSLSASAAESSQKISGDLDVAIKEGLDELYNFNFDQSLAIFDSIKDQEVDHPMVAFGVASTHWWRISSLVLEADKAESKPFIEAANNCIRLAEIKIKKGDPSGEGHLVLGGALGLLGRWQATNHQWVSAYFSGKKAYKYLDKALKINPELIDANMGLGIFDYFAATLPAVVRALTFVGKGGDPKIGLAELEEAAEKGVYSRTPSKLFLTQIYTQIEGTPEKAITILTELRKQYPRSPFIHMMKNIALYNAGELDQLTVEAAEFEKMIDNKTYEKFYACEANFSMALPYFKGQKWKEASDYFAKAQAAGDEKNPWKTWAGLYLGYSYDAMGQRPEAVKQYKWVLTQLRRWGSHEMAKSHLSRPFKVTETNLKKLEL